MYIKAHPCCMKYINTWYCLCFQPELITDQEEIAQMWSTCDQHVHRQPGSCKVTWPRQYAPRRRGACLTIVSRAGRLEWRACCWLKVSINRSQGPAYRPMVPLVQCTIAQCVHDYDSPVYKIALYLLQGNNRISMYICYVRLMLCWYNQDALENICQLGQQHWAKIQKSIWIIRIYTSQRKTTSATCILWYILISYTIMH